jgi:VWFA-related protein
MMNGELRICDAGLKPRPHTWLAGLKPRLHTWLAGLTPRLHTCCAGLKPRLHTCHAGLKPRLHTCGGRASALLVAVVLAAALGVPLAAQQPSRPTFETQSTIVLLDVVVRDKKGRPVRDLKPEELQVFEDGQRRELTSFRLVEGQASEERVAPDASTGLQPDPSRQVSLVTMVFDKLMDGRQLSQQAALDFLANNMEANVWVSVWTIDQRLYLRQEFTQDRYLLRQAVLKATNTTSVAAASLSGEAAFQDQIARDSATVAGGLQDAAAGTPGGAGGADSSGIGQANAQAQMAQVVAGILRFTSSIQRQQQGQSSLYPLLGMVKAQGRLAGRKTMLYFSEGLVVPKNLEEVFKTTIGEANRANVTIYAIDARGLSSARDSDATRDQLLQAARTSQQQMAKRGAGAVSVDEVMIAENAEESLRSNVQESLNEFAKSTGGFLIGNTNDFKPAMARVATDIGSYYEAAYAPVSQELDGRFRRIDVKVTRPGVTVQSRSGYFALPPGEGSALLPFELPLLTALTVDPAPHAFTFQSAVLQFGASKAGREHLLVFEVPLQTMSFQEDRRAKLYRLRFSLLALVRDAEGRIVERFSDDYPFEGPLANLEGVKRGNLIFKRPFTLSPGAYTADFVAQDRDSGRTSVQRTKFTVMPAEPAVTLSTLNIVRRIEEAAPDLPADDPFRVDRTRVVPNFNLPIPKSQNTNLSVYFVVYTTPGATPKMAIEFLKGDSLLARAKPDLPQAGADGRIPYVVTVPIEGFAPGEYSVRGLVMQGGAVAESETAFTIDP